MEENFVKEPRQQYPKRSKIPKTSQDSGTVPLDRGHNGYEKPTCGYQNERLEKKDSTLPQLNRRVVYMVKEYNYSQFIVPGEDFFELQCIEETKADKGIKLTGTEWVNKI